MGLDMRKPDFVIYKLQMHRLACSTAKSDQGFVIRFKESIIAPLATNKISILQLFSVAEQTLLSLTCRKTQKCRGP